MRKMLSALAALTLLVVSTSARAEEKKKTESEFARTTIDVGVLVSDIEKSAKFYTDVIGFTEIDGFSVSGEFCKDAGLTDGRPLTIRVFVLGKGETATHLKLMQVVGASPKKSESEFVTSQFGFRYLTLLVVDTDAALARLKKAGVAPLGKGPVALPANLKADGVFLTCVKDPDGNFVELVGPRKK